MSDAVRILLLADTHLGFDLPTRARVQRRRRGHDFLDNYAAALAPALNGEVDLVVHGGDVFNRSRVPSSTAWLAFEPLTRVADRGVPIVVVPGNHERGRIPQIRFAQHPRIHIFDRPRTFRLDVQGVRVAVAGFPSERHDVRGKFAGLVEATGWRTEESDVRLLCMHQCVEGATVGPSDYTFTTASDVVRAADIPGGFAAVLTGHIHRHQVLTTDLRGAHLGAPVLYPGSIERTSVAEAHEEKGYLRVDVAPGRPVSWRFERLHARPLVRRELDPQALSGEQLEAAVRALIDASAPDAILTIRVVGEPSAAAWRVLSSANLRRLAPPTMNVEVRGERWGSAPRSQPFEPTASRMPELPF
ncbi:MAG TPA: metallophosphoesterase [Gemmatimonadaceae bacterium]